MSGERWLIINADDFGMCHSSNQAVATLLTEGAVTSASIMMTCPWIKEAISMVKQNPHWDVGVHLTLTSEWEHYKWGPLDPTLTTLCDNDYGYFPANPMAIIENADHEEIRREAINQIELALKMGLDPTNIDNHQGSMGHVPEILLELCEKYALPLRYPRNDLFGNPDHEKLVKLADEKGIILPDSIELLPFFSPDGENHSYEMTKTAAEKIIKELKVGITELILHPAMGTDELKGITDTWQIRHNDFEIFRDKDIVQLLKYQNIQLTTWRELRERQRR